MGWEAATALAAVAQTVAVFVALGIARGQLNEAKTAREKQAEGAAHAEELRTRPYVVVSFDVHTRFPWILLLIENVGQTAAYDVMFDVEPKLTSSLDDADTGDMGDRPIFRSGIRTLAPGQRIPIFFDISFSRKAPHSDLYHLKATYGSETSSKPYVSRYDLDLSIYWGLEVSQPKSLDDIHKVLDNVAKTLNSVKSGNSVKVITQTMDQRREDEVEQRRLREQRRRLRDEARQTPSTPNEDEPTE
ncbi:MAG: hypothetical protein GEV08_20035 [Acidimicrobiia bacterium]|nr:hypothetical protein [Acidimicrobiia bacterium]